MDRPIAFVAADWAPSALTALRELGYEVRTSESVEHGRPAVTLAEQAAGAVILVTGPDPVDDALLDAVPSVEIVCTTADRLSQVDVPACTLRRVPVLCVPAGPADTETAAICAELARIGTATPPRYCVNPVDVLPVTPPAYFAQLRHSAEFNEGVRSRELVVT